MVQNFFFPLGQYSVKSQKRMAPASVESRMGGRNKNVALSTLLLLKLGDQMLCPYIIQTASNCVALKAAGVRTKLQNDAATNPPIQGRKNTHLCPEIACAN